jgi:hypothetical protein
MQEFLSLVGSTFFVSLADQEDPKTPKSITSILGRLDTSSQQISTALNGIFEARKPPEISPEILKEERGKYADQLNTLLGSVGALSEVLNGISGTDPNQLRSQRVKDNLSASGLMDREGKWKSVETSKGLMWTREGVVNPPPEAILIVGPTDTPAASLERNVDEFEFTGEAQKDGKFKQVSEVLRETSIGDEGVDALKVQVDKATSLLRFVTGDGRSRGLIQELLVQRETFAQTTGRMKPSIEAKYKDTADEIEKFAKALNTYYVGDDAQVQSLITELAEAQIIYERRTRPSGYEWVKKGGGPRDTGSTVDVPFKKKPFAFEFGEAKRYPSMQSIRKIRRLWLPHSSASKTDVSERWICKGPLPR